MLTRNRLQRDEGELEPFDAEAGHAHRRRSMADEEACYEEELNFCKTFYAMAKNVGQLLSRLEKAKERNLEEQGSMHGNGGE